MPEIIGIAITKKTYADRGIIRGQRIKTMMRRAFESVLPTFSEHVKKTYLSGPTSATTISARSKKLRDATSFSIAETPKGVAGVLSVGGNVPYASLHVGSTGERITLTTAKRFVVPHPDIRNKDGSWRAPYSPGNLRNVPGLFRRGDVLYQRMASGKPRARFFLKQSITIPQRVDMRSIEYELRPRLLQTMKLEFDNYDYGYLRMMQSE